MAFRGLFIGVDRHASPRIEELSCAVRDARALFALFADSVGDEGLVLLENASANRGRILEELEQLATVSDDDVVVVFFSGHGSKTHELTTYDADPDDFAATALPLELLAEHLTRIPARQVFCALDCCFSGGAGAKVLKFEDKARGLLTVEDLLTQMSGNGRLIFTASSETEQAFENPRLGHGVFTYYLLQALQGDDEVLSDGKIDLFRLISFVTEKVTSFTLRTRQTPTLKGNFTGAISWPILKPGTYFARFFPDYSTSVATPALTSLEAFGFPAELVASLAAIPIRLLNPLQLEAINDFGLFQGQHLVVSAPTSSGKTLIGELAAIRGILEQKKAFFLLPLKALVNDKYAHFQRAYGPYGIRTIRATGEISDNVPDLIRGHYDLCLMTYEKFTALLLGFPALLNHVGTIVIDEVQMIADPTRGVNLEFLLTQIKLRRQEQIEPQVIALSAVIGATNGLEDWLGGRLLRREERPIPLDEGVLLPDGSFRYIASDTAQETAIPHFITPIQGGKGSSQDAIIPLVRRLVGEDKQVIVFREVRGAARGCAAYLAKYLNVPRAAGTLTRLPQRDPSLSTRLLAACLEAGVAFHISDLDKEERALIEEAYRQPQSEIRVIAATTTLAMGINTPAEAVVVAGLKHPGRGGQQTPYTIAEYKNIVGRAGRLGYAMRGTSFLIASNLRDADHYWQHYVLGRPEDLISHFLGASTDIRSLVIRYLAFTHTSRPDGLSQEEVTSFLESSFGAFQLARRQEGWVWDQAAILSALQTLEAHCLVARDNDRLRLTPLGLAAGRAGLEVESVLRIQQAYSAAAPAEALHDPDLLLLTHLTKEFDSQFVPVNSNGAAKERASWLGYLQSIVQAGQMHPRLLQYVVNRPREIRDLAAQLKSSVACLTWVTNDTLEDIEQYLTRHLPDRNMAGAIRSLATRTQDLLPAVMEILHALEPQHDYSAEVGKLLIRLELGIPGDTVDVARLMGAQLSRGQYLQLRRQGLHQLEALVAASEDDLAPIVGDKAPELCAAAQRALENPPVPVLVPTYVP